ncbi:MAG: RIP metalloprotease RseP [Chlorobium sp.]|jgi:regulator of sigma E protease|uniref:RIP metalloprotease RseP n=1 Tax=Chlorobium sp. TaxID=1095 RepID=UPI001E0A2872|nr:RIP metalloprotease RseP [Chlorobium sp.]MBN1278636.1 RIP metalloprotease RseP [Chlorobiaceae bacterium]MCF8216358.1 RIP metalloprotease RseP [Chlorobium sp.]MCF8271261.1 RIP metalloprotease RseP [Chlorobium sp.]MCF8287635.1 RIP metalloprotease RseP [Chlorobium sp.]MCF8291174.1 RIP metalloprotease RseP [Chlorobium sp.]
MDVLNTTFFFIVAIFILVTAHELGHFLTAKLFGMRVDKFYIGFDFFNMRLWKKKIGETEYGIGVFPLGGYVKIAGMVDESLDTAYQASEPQPWEFRAKPVWQRLIVLAGGVFMNMMLAAVIFIGVTLTFGESRTTVDNPAYIETGSAFSLMGMQTGDRIAAVNGKAVSSWEEALDPATFTAPSLSYTVLRDGKQVRLNAPANMLSRLNENQALGIRPVMAPVIDDVLASEPAAKAGIKPGALITAINGKSVSDWTEVVSIISANAGKPLDITWKYLEPSANKQTDPAAILESGSTTVTEVVPNAAGKIGIALRQTLQTERISLNIFESIASGTAQTWKMSVMTVQGFARIFTGQEDFRKSLGGPVKIAKIAGRSAEQGPISFLFFLAVLSISLAVINMLPIPALDGGQFVMNAIEGIMGRELPFEVKMRIQQIGMALLLTLFAYILLNDILNP